MNTDASNSARPTLYAPTEYPPGSKQYTSRTTPYGPTTSSYGYNPYNVLATPQPPNTTVKQEPASESELLPTERSPEPTPSFAPHWDSALKAFFQDLGLLETLRGFETDILMLNPDWEQERVPSALKRLSENILALSTPDNSEPKPSLEERKLDYVHLSNGSKPVHPTTLTKSISKFIAQNRARNDASNREEFLLSLQEKRARRGPDGMDVDEPSCARTDAKTIDRNQQIQYDVAKNDSQLKRTMNKKQNESSEGEEKGKGKSKADPVEQAPYTEYDERVTADRHPGLDARLVNVEEHFAVHYVPSPPVSLLARIKLLEDHIIRLEKDHPPWAALHFNQPNRDWPPPPPSTPLIVPYHLAKVDRHNQKQDAEPRSAARGNAKGKSSLHKAVMDRLEVQKAMKELGSGS